MKCSICGKSNHRTSDCYFCTSKLENGKLNNKCIPISDFSF